MPHPEAERRSQDGFWIEFPKDTIPSNAHMSIIFSSDEIKFSFPIPVSASSDKGGVWINILGASIGDSVTILISGYETSPDPSRPLYGEYICMMIKQKDHWVRRSHRGNIFPLS